MSFHDIHVYFQGGRWQVRSGAAPRSAHPSRDQALAEALQAARARTRRGGRPRILLQRPGDARFEPVWQAAGPG